jgi:hypothetical protein
VTPLLGLVQEGWSRGEIPVSGFRAIVSTTGEEGIVTGVLERTAAIILASEQWRAEGREPYRVLRLLDQLLVNAADVRFLKPRFKAA